MSIRGLRLSVSVMAVAMVCGLLIGCGGRGDSALTKDNPGINDLNVVVAFGDSITLGSQCSCVPYPARLSAMIGKVVYNTGVGGSKAESSVGRTQQAINKYHPAYMLILYGINDIIHSHNVNGILGALNQIVLICKQNNVVPVLATYPIPIAGHQLFGFNTMLLNEGIRTIATAYGIRCVDLEKELAGEPDPTAQGFVISNPALYEPDGLHPNDEARKS